MGAFRSCALWNVGFFNFAVLGMTHVLEMPERDPGVDRRAGCCCDGGISQTHVQVYHALAGWGPSLSKTNLKRP